MEECFCCYHPSEFGLNDDIVVDDTICRFCGTSSVVKNSNLQKAYGRDGYLDDSRLSKDFGNVI